MVDPLSYFFFQPVFHDWYNKDRGMCYPVYGMVHTKDQRVAHVMGAAGFPSRYMSGPLQYVRRRITVNKM